MSFSVTAQFLELASLPRGETELQAELEVQEAYHAPYMCFVTEDL